MAGTLLIFEDDAEKAKALIHELATWAKQVAPAEEVDKKAQQIIAVLQGEVL